MKFLALLLLLFFSAGTQAASWVSVEPDRPNFLYNEGEQAKFVFRLLNRPVNPNLRIKVNVEDIDLEQAEEIEIIEDVGVYSTELLQPGIKHIRIAISIVDDLDFENLVQESNLTLKVQAH